MNADDRKPVQLRSNSTGFRAVMLLLSPIWLPISFINPWLAFGMGGVLSLIALGQLERSSLSLEGDGILVVRNGPFRKRVPIESIRVVRWRRHGVLSVALFVDSSLEGRGVRCWGIVLPANPVTGTPRATKVLAVVLQELGRIGLPAPAPAPAD